MRGKTGQRACAQELEGNEPRQFRAKFTVNPASGGSRGAVYAHCELHKQKILPYSPEFSPKKLRCTFTIGRHDKGYLTISLYLDSGDEIQHG